MGIGRAPGGSAEATNALSDQFLQKVWNMPTVLKELLQLIAQELYLADEIMILTITDNIEDRLKSYQLLANLL